MTHSYSKLLYHFIWSTKNRESFIFPEIKNRLYGYIRASINDVRNQHVCAINGMPDHLHLLVNLLPTTLISDFVKHVKTSSTKWLHSTPINMKTFGWQEGYAVYTVGYSNMKSVCNYIENQEIHHQTISFEDEYLSLLKMQNIDYDHRFVVETPKNDVPLPRYQIHSEQTQSCDR